MKTHGWKLRERYKEYDQVCFFQLKATNAVASLAASLAERMALCAADLDGEDSAGRQKVKLMTPAEIAVRACDIAAALWQQFEQRDWIMDLPEPQEKKDD